MSWSSANGARGYRSLIYLRRSRFGYFASRCAAREMATFRSGLPVAASTMRLLHANEKLGSALTSWRRGRSLRLSIPTRSRCRECWSQIGHAYLWLRAGPSKMGLSIIASGQAAAEGVPLRPSRRVDIS